MPVGGAIPPDWDGPITLTAIAGTRGLDKAHGAVWEMSKVDLALVGDIGGTNARFALVELEDGAARLHTPKSHRCEDHVSLQAAIEAYLESLDTPVRPSAVCVAVAGPVTDGVAAFTNLPWIVSEADLQDAGFKRARVINDYEALAFGAPDLTASDVQAIGKVAPVPEGHTIAVMGAGTGFGVSALSRRQGEEVVSAGEGGHISFAPVDELEVEVLRRLALRFGRVSIERILSGPGLLNLYQAMADIADSEAPLKDPAEITAKAQAGDDLARHAVERFCAIFGAVAGDFALTYGAKGGIYLAGGIAPQMVKALNGGGFRRAFEAKGRLKPYLQSIPTYVVTHPYLALVGSARALRTCSRAD
jgi:glucokinase